MESRLNIGGRSGKHWNGTGNRYVRSGKAHARGSGSLHLAQAQRSIVGGEDLRGFPECPNAVKRLVAQELNLSFIARRRTAALADGGALKAPN